MDPSLTDWMAHQFLVNNRVITNLAEDKPFSVKAVSNPPSPASPSCLQASS